MGGGGMSREMRMEYRRRGGGSLTAAVGMATTTTALEKEEVIRYWHPWGGIGWPSFGRAAKKEDGTYRGRKGGIGGGGLVSSSRKRP